MVSRKGILRWTSCFLAGALLFLFLGLCAFAATLDDLKQLEITCYVPSYLPQGLRLKNVEVTYEVHENENQNHPLPLYSIQYGNGWNATFTIESAREGIGDRNIMPDEQNAEETDIKSPFGPMYLIYRPKGKDGRKDEIIANWVSDPNMNAEKNKAPDSHPVLGRFHGFSATGITLTEFTKIVQSLHPIESDKVLELASIPANSASATEASALKIHPKVFNMIDCWISDSESPVATEINLNAVEKNGNQFNEDGLTQDGEWLNYSLPETGGFMRYRVLETKGNHYKIEYQENGGGTLTTASTIEFDIEKRTIRRDGSPLTIRVLRVSSYAQK